MKKSILIVEDDQNQRTLISEELESKGYEVQQACNGKEGLTKFKEKPPHLVIMDIRMPEMDGIETMGRLVEEEHNVPVIFYSAYSTYKKNYLSWSADAYVVKSSDLTDLMEKVEELLKDDAI